jgi:hypothetical protein
LVRRREEKRREEKRREEKRGFLPSFSFLHLGVFVLIVIAAIIVLVLLLRSGKLDALVQGKQRKRIGTILQYDVSRP